MVNDKGPITYHFLKEQRRICIQGRMQFVLSEHDPKG